MADAQFVTLFEALMAFVSASASSSCLLRECIFDLRSVVRTQLTPLATRARAAQPSFGFTRNARLCHKSTRRRRRYVRERERANEPAGNSLASHARVNAMLCVCVLACVLAYTTLMASALD